MKTVRRAVMAAVVAMFHIAVAGALATAMWGVVARAMNQRSSAVPFRVDEILTVVAAAVGLVLLAWLLLGYLIALSGALPGHLGHAGRTAARHLSPVLARRLAAATLGLGGTTLAVASPALAATPAATSIPEPGWAVTASSDAGAPATQLHGPSSARPSPGGSTPGSPTPSSSSATHPTSTSPAPARPSDPAASGQRAADAAPTPPASSGWVPRSATVRPQPSSGLVTGGARTEPSARREVTVQRGQTLWGIAAAHAGRDATDVEIARHVEVWHAVNRTVVGADPDRLLPGQRLAVPSPRALEHGTGTGRLS